MSTKEKIKVVPVRLRSIEIAKGDTTYKADLIRMNPDHTRIEVFEQSAKEVTIKTPQEIVTSRKQIKLRPEQTEGVKMEEIAKRAKVLEQYLSSTSIEDAITEVANEVKKSKDKATKDVVLSWQYRANKDLDFPCEIYYLDVPETKTVETESIQTQFEYEKIKTFNLYYRVRSRDFRKCVNNYLNQL